MIDSEPSHLTKLVTNVDKATLLKIQKEYGESTTAFKFYNKFESIIFSYNKEANEYGGRVWGVNSGGIRLLIFDQLKHGYNGVLELNEEDDISTTKTIDFPEIADIVVAFQYNGDESEFIHEGTSTFEQDYFGWIAIYKCSKEKLEEIISFECA